jgi:hypothetical protein
MLLSKMHYALELARAGNKVFFVNPPRESDNRKLAAILQVKEEGNLIIIDTKIIRASLFLRHKLFFAFRWVSKRYVKAIQKIVGGKIDEVWCFNPQIYVNLRDFQAGRSILLIYDFYRGDHVFKAAGSADAVISVSQLILDHYKSAAPPKLLLQHGLGKRFADRALKKLRDAEFRVIKGEKVKVGYMGNLLRAGMNIPVAKKIIETHPGVEFHFWGPYSMEDNNVTDPDVNIAGDIASFIGFLKQQKHVFLHGVLEQEALAAALFEMDVFLFLFSSRLEVNGASNSHKLLEYLSTGNAVVSTFVSNYQGTDLLTMCEKDKEDSLPDIFDSVIDKLPVYNAIEKQKQRMTFALDNTYVRQVERIQQFIH